MTTPDRYPWMDDAACLDQDPEIFFPVTSLEDSAAWDEPRGVCERCPVRAECLQLALDQGSSDGMYGGLTPDERRNLTRRQKRAEKAGVA